MRDAASNLGELPSERQFQAIVSEYQKLSSSDLSLGNETWRTTGNRESRVIDQLHSAIHRPVYELMKKPNLAFIRHGAGREARRRPFGRN